ncbi:MAG: carbon-monoxide dehydrogenase large subunit, partial [Ilumatobacter sp.]
MTAEHTAMSPSSTPGSILGTRVTRTEDPALLTGAAIYLDDLHIEGTLHAVFVRSDVAHGTINSIDTDEASSMPGIVAVLTFADLGVPAHHGFAP